jgi:ubiquinone/menaquinone biosynthesis C-methylase UbiE
LGCGDAHQIANQLASLNIQSYTGYDLSNQAIDLAKQHLQKTNAKLEFQVGKMEDQIKTESNTYNLLYSSFAIHHLKDEDKKVFINDCAQHLEQNGLFILIDIKRLPGQSTDEYKKSYAEWIYQDWHNLLPEEKDAIVSHLQTCDIPVEIDTYVEYAKQAGLSLIEEVAIDDRHALLVFSNNYSNQDVYPH